MSQSSDPQNETPGVTPGASGANDPVGDLLPRVGVDSRWWYWIAAVPVYFALTLAFGALLVPVFLLGFAFDAGVAVALFAVVGGVFVALPGLALAVLFPVAVYVDARAVSAADVGWNPDPALYGLVALAGVLVTAFTVSVPLALYYLYRRHGAVGVP